jgi:hypothetical protein
VAAQTLGKKNRSAGSATAYVDEKRPREGVKRKKKKRERKNEEKERRGEKKRKKKKGSGES